MEEEERSFSSLGGDFILLGSLLVWLDGSVCLGDNSTRQRPELLGLAPRILAALMFFGIYQRPEAPVFLLSVRRGLRFLGPPIFVNTWAGEDGGRRGIKSHLIKSGTGYPFYIREFHHDIPWSLLCGKDWKKGSDGRRGERRKSAPPLTISDRHSKSPSND